VSARAGRKPDRVDALVARLSMLQAIDRDRALAVATEIVAGERSHRALEPALKLIEPDPPADARQPLRQRFFDLAEDGLHRDVDCELRALIVRALRSLDSHADEDVAEAGLRTVQPTPPSMTDVAQPLRAESLLLLAQSDPDRADYWAAELLSDPHLSEFSGEPAVTAIRLLDRRGQRLPIWALARRPGLQVDALAQAFASLRDAPSDLQLGALREHLAWALPRGEPGEPTALVAAEALVLNRLEDGYGLVLDLLRQTPNLNLFRYLAMTALRSDAPRLRRPLADLRAAVDAAKADALRELLGEG
jgi:hypothetical protein